MRLQIGIAALLAAGVVAGPIVSDARAQSAVTIGAQSTPIGAGQYINLWNPPGGLTVTAGGTVTFANPGPLDHTVQFGTQQLRGLGIGTSQTFTAPSTPGPVQYFCTIHPSTMQGVLTVVAAPAPTATPTPTPTPTPNPAPITPVNVTPATSLVSGISTSRRSWKVTVRFELRTDATVTARLKTRNGSRTLKKVVRDLDAGSRSVTISRSFTGGARYRVLLEIVDDAGHVENRTVNFTGAYR
jgi:plastocyanin